MIKLVVLVTLLSAVTSAYRLRRLREKDVKVTHKAFMDIQIDGKDAGRIVFGLFGEVVPKTVRNFREFCLGTKRRRIKYVASYFHYVTPGLIQGGDVRRDGSSTSYWGDEFPDENFEIGHFPGCVSMANKGRRDTNGSQFFITVVDTPEHDGNHVVFGKVLEGMDLVKKISKMETDSKKRPLKKVMVRESGLM